MITRKELISVINCYERILNIGGTLDTAIESKLLDKHEFCDAINSDPVLKAKLTELYDTAEYKLDQYIKERENKRRK